jgi:hypothetical protein
MGQSKENDVSIGLYLLNGFITIANSCTGCCRRRTHLVCFNINIHLTTTLYD